ncbi:MAG: hypothetical protein FD127_3961 [Acidimicrobiaceae bacterium]|nr:MAG: hypothetical protein FD127_3961 [Acidimicrobiaceae bacterium]
MASPWSLGPSPRGFAVEEALGGNLPRSTNPSADNPTSTAVVGLHGTKGLAVQADGRVTIVWPLDEGIYALSGDRRQAVEIAQDISTVDETTWNDASVAPDPKLDGCQSFFC